MRNTLEIIKILIILKIATAPSVNAQIVPDNTLPENSVVNPSEQLQQITGGTTAGSNLFHSFSEFNVLTGETAYFDNAASIENILTRVTGGQLSNINGLIRANGTANLFLLNPSGIIFGANARLDIGGSFVSSTGDRIIFQDGFTFSAIATQTTPLLTMSVPIGISYLTNAQPIEVQAGATLETRSGENLFLLGGNINLSGAQIRAPGGRVELGGLREAGTVAIAPDGSLSFPAEVGKGDVSLRDSSQVDVRSSGGGDIAVNGQNVDISGAQLQAGIGEGLGEDGAIAGDIVINATNTVRVDSLGIVALLGEEGATVISNNVEASGVGNGGAIAINTSSLEIVNGAQIAADIEGVGDGGTIAINADFVFLDGQGTFEEFFSRFSDISSTVQPGAVGNSGGAIVNTGTLKLQRGGLISAGTLGQGDAGSIVINATEVLLDGQETFALIQSSVQPGAVGNAGGVIINTDTLEVINSQIQSGTFGQGDGGSLIVQASDVKVIGSIFGISPSTLLVSVEPMGIGNAGELSLETERLQVSEGGAIFATAFGQGNGGDLNITATEIELTGTRVDGVPSQIGVGTSLDGNAGNLSITTEQLFISDGGQIGAGTFGDGRGGNISVQATQIEVSGAVAAPVEIPPGDQVFLDSSGTMIPSGVFAGSPGTGDSGTIDLQTNNLTLSDRAQISVSSEDEGAAGNLNIVAPSIVLNNSILNANTVEGDLANINLNTSNIQLRQGSQITTNATGEATGGNITINTETLAALENSDITANAEQSFGGQVIINGEGIFGTQFREELTPESDITATSELGASFSGTVTINTPEVDPGAGLVKLPEQVTDLDHGVITGCAAAAKGNSFTVSGRGGIPANPTAIIRGQTIWRDFQDFSTVARESENVSPQTLTPNLPPLVEATSWIINEEGNVELVARLPNNVLVRQLPKCSDVWGDK